MRLNTLNWRTIYYSLIVRNFVETRNFFCFRFHKKRWSNLLTLSWFRIQRYHLEMWTFDRKLLCSLDRYLRLWTYWQSTKSSNYFECGLFIKIWVTDLVLNRYSFKKICRKEFLTHYWRGFSSFCACYLHFAVRAYWKSRTRLLS